MSNTDRDVITFDSSTHFLEALTCARVWSSSPSDYRPHLEGVHLECVVDKDGGKRVYMVATNGVGLWVRGPSADHRAKTIGYVFSVELSLFDVRAISGAIKALRRPCEVIFSQSGSKQYARIGRTTLELEGLDGEHFLPWRHVVPKPSSEPKVSTALLSPTNLLKAFKSLKPKTPSFATRLDFGTSNLDPIMIRGKVADESTFVLLMPMTGDCDADGAPI